MAVNNLVSSFKEI